MSNQIQFKPLSWILLSRFLACEKAKRSQDVDRDVLFMNVTLYTASVVEGFYLDDVLVGFGRWNSLTRHLDNVYVTENARGHGIASKFITERAIRTLYVIPHNHEAKKLYTRLGFKSSPCAVPTREFMTRAMP